MREHAYSSTNPAKPYDRPPAHCTSFLMTTKSHDQYQQAEDPGLQYGSSWEYKWHNRNSSCWATESSNLNSTNQQIALVEYNHAQQPARRETAELMDSCGMQEA